VLPGALLFLEGTSQLPGWNDFWFEGTTSAIEKKTNPHQSLFFIFLSTTTL